MPFSCSCIFCTMQPTFPVDIQTNHIEQNNNCRRPILFIFRVRKLIYLFVVFFFFFEHCIHERINTMSMKLLLFILFSDEPFFVIAFVNLLFLRIPISHRPSIFFFFSLSLCTIIISNRRVQNISRQSY